MPDIQIMGVVADRAAAEQVVGNARLAGFPQDDVSVVMVRREDAEQMDEAADQTGQGAADVAKSAATGAGIGGLIGAAAGAATLLIPGLGPIIGSGILVALFGGSGAFVGALSGAFASEDTKAEIVNRYGMALREGQAIVCVTARDTETAKAAEQMLNDAGASNVNSYLADSQS